MAFYKRLNNGNPNDTIKVAAGMNNCCGASETVETYANTAHNATSTPITGIVIDGTTYTFTAAADTAAELITGVREAFTAPTATCSRMKAGRWRKPAVFQPGLTIPPSVRSIPA